jgi:hypothetical protein
VSIPKGYLSLSLSLSLDRFYIAQTALEFTILLPPLTESWYYRPMPLYPGGGRDF